MTTVSQSAGPRTVPTRTAQPVRGPEPAPADVAAMRQAIDSARGRLAPAAEQPQPGKGKAALAKGEGASAKGEASPALVSGDQGQVDGKGPVGERKAPAHGRDAGDDHTLSGQGRLSGEEQAVSALDRRQERRDQFEGFALPGQSNAPVPLPMPTMPSPQANPAAFAQMMADLWMRENGKGSKEVSVRFGRDAWPATGARLVRNAAGALDVTLYVGDRGRRYGDDLSDLAGALGDAGVMLGSLEMEAA